MGLEWHHVDRLAVAGLLLSSGRLRRNSRPRARLRVPGGMRERTVTSTRKTRALPGQAARTSE
eukprot:7958548-Alexandrium_andersonii.AAC.1